MHGEILSGILGEDGRADEMSSTTGENIRVSIFGQSHAEAIGMTMEGFPAGFRIDMEALERFMERRAPGRSEWSTPRNESDRVRWLCGVVDGVTCGAPMTAIIENTNSRSADYSEIRDVPRPGHADYTAQVKYSGNQDVSGGGHFSGRLTAGMCIAGGVCRQYLEERRIRIHARIVSIGGITDGSEFSEPVEEKEFPVVSDEIAERMKEEIRRAKEDGDSVGGIIECRAEGIPAGIGDPIFGGMENRLAAILFGIPAVKGVEFGDGFECAKSRGSDNNDAYEVKDGKIVTATNHAGGILGGITNGMPLIFRVAVKPTPSIAKEQRSVRLSTMEETTVRVRGRHDPCIVPRAVPCVEAACAIAVMDAYLGRKKEEAASE